MNAASVRIEPLHKDNYDTWKLQMRAILIKNDAWGYVSGTIVKPKVVTGEPETAVAAQRWTEADLKAQSDIVLAMNPSEIKQTKGCETSRAIWEKLEAAYQSKGPARKVALLNHLMSLKLQDGGDAHEHSRCFFDTVDRLAELEVEINNDLLAVMLLRSLPESFENFRCAMSSRDELPPLETLRIKIDEEFDARKDTKKCSVQNAMAAGKSGFGRGKHDKGREKSEKDKSANSDLRLKCFKCGKMGHRAKNCRNTKKPKEQPAGENGNVCLVVTKDSARNGAFRAGENADYGGWCLDSGCTSHMCKDMESFALINQNHEPGKLNLASSACTDIKGKGVVSTVTNVSGRRKMIELSDTLYVPDLRTNLVSVGKITDKGHKVIFSETKAQVINCDGDVLLTAKRKNGLYYFQSTRNAECNKICAPDEKARVVKRNSLEDWHIRMGHLNVQSLREAIRTGSIQGVNVADINEDFECSVCFQGKMCRSSFPKASVRVTEPGELVHSDVCGPMRVPSLARKRYFATFIDDFSGWCEVSFISEKHEVLNKFNDFRVLTSTQQGKSIKCLQSDNGKEYVNRNFDELLRTHGIVRRLTAPYNPQQNGVAERRNRTLMEMARCLLIQSKLPETFWAEAVNTANYIRNRSPTSKLKGKTPYEARFGKTPDVTNFKRFGCNMFVMDRTPGKGKLEARSRKGIFVGYSSESKAYRIWLPEEKRIVISRDVRFLDDVSTPLDDNNEDLCSQERHPELPNSSTDIKEMERQGPHVIINVLDNRESNDHDDNRTEGQQHADDNEECDDEDFLGFPEESPEALSRGPGRPRIVRSGRPGRPRKGHGAASHAISVANDDIALLSEIPVAQAMVSPESTEWMAAMADEVKSILAKDTWDLVDRSEASDVIGSRFVLRNKYGANGALEKRKARIVAKGYAQQYGKDFHETYAPVARLSSIRSTVALAAQRRMHIRQYDVTTAYLNGELDEEVYMEVPGRMREVLQHIISERSTKDLLVNKATAMLAELSAGDKVCHMRKALYGLKQAGRAWYKHLDRELRAMGAEPTNGDPCVYTKYQGNELIIIVIYVDDILIMCRNLEVINRFGDKLSDLFEIKALGDVKRCLGMDFRRDGEGIFINQKTYIRDTLRKFGMLDCNAVSTPLDVGTKLVKDEPWSSADGEKPPYRELIGCLLYLSVARCPDIAHAASSLSQFNDCFSRIHWGAAKRVLRYLKGTDDLGILYRPGAESLVGYVDADWGGSPDDRRSFTGYAFEMSGGVVTWDSRKQRTVALSTTEAEYMALSEATKEAIHLQRFLLELGVTDIGPVTLFNDNFSAQKLATNPVFHARTKHIDIRHHFVREVTESGQVILEHLATDEMPADVLTKALVKPKHVRCIGLLGLARTPTESPVVTRGSVGNTDRATDRRPNLNYSSAEALE